MRSFSTVTSSVTSIHYFDPHHFSVHFFRLLRETVKHLVATEGVRGLSKGFTLNIIKGPVVMSLSLTTYDSLLAHYREHSDISVAPHAIAVSM